MYTKQLSPVWFRGGCLTFAKALQRRLGRGAKLVDIVEPEPHLAHVYTHPGRPHHVVVEQDGVLWDAAGPHTPDEVIAFWSEQIRVPVELEPHRSARAKDQGLKVKRDLTDYADADAQLVVDREL
jgi:hypothetical protein